MARLICPLFNSTTPPTQKCLVMLCRNLKYTQSIIFLKPIIKHRYMGMGMKPDLAYFGSKHQDISGGEVSVDEPFPGQVLHAERNLLGEAQEQLAELQHGSIRHAERRR